MSKQIKVGIIGCAAIAKRSLAPAFSAHNAFELASVASRTPGKAIEFAAPYKAHPCSYDELVDSDDIDLVYCPLPTGLHHEWVKKCILSGKHVLCEKSLGSTYDEVNDLVDVAREHGLFLMESFQFRFHAQNLFVKKQIEEGTLGPIRQVVVRFGIPPFPEGAANIRYSLELGGGALLDNGAYTVKAATYLFGPDIQVLAAVKGGETDVLGGVDLTGAIMMRTRDGVPIQTAYGFDHFYQNGYEIWGVNGKITTTRAFTAREDFAAPVIIETAQGRTEHAFRDDHFARLLDYVAKSISSGDFTSEYEECLNQARILQDVRKEAWA